MFLLRHPVYAILLQQQMFEVPPNIVLILIFVLFLMFLCLECCIPTPTYGIFTSLLRPLQKVITHSLALPQNLTYTHVAELIQMSPDDFPVSLPRS